MPWDNGWWAQCDRLFEMHDLELLQMPEAKRPSDYMERLQLIDVPLYMQKQYFPNVTPYPVEEVALTTADYFNSSIAYMLALAIHEHANGDYIDKIELWGIDMVDGEEYAYQRPNAEYLIGMAIGLGIDVHVPVESYLTRFNAKNIPLGTMYPHYPKRYGYL